jgi:hypothetical protein
MSKPTYSLFKESNWGTPRWVIAAPKSSPFGRYSTATAARKDAKVYGLKLERREDLDSQYF